MLKVQRRFQGFLSPFMALALLVGLLPALTTPAAADDDFCDLYYGYVVVNTTLKFAEFLDGGGTPHFLPLDSNLGVVISQSGDASTNRRSCILVYGNGTANITLDGVNISTLTESPMTIDAGSTVNLTLSGSNKLISTGDDFAGLNVRDGANLTITSASNGSSLTAQGGKYAAGIGGNKTGSCGNIDIQGGTIAAYSKDPQSADYTTDSGIIIGSGYGAGIGGGWGGAGTESSGNINISGGEVTASSYCGAGVGGGQDGAGTGDSGSINISGGIVTATSLFGAGIGGGSGGSGTGSSGSINISGGTTTAIGGSGAGIGGGTYGSDTGDSGSINISGGTTTAIGGSGAGIGGGATSSGTGDSGSINITGGIVIAKSETKTFNHASGNQICFPGNSPGIGGGGGGQGSTVVISGGTVTATGAGGGEGIGTGPGGTGQGSCQITGGSVNAGSMGPTPTSDGATGVYLTKVTLADATGVISEAAVTSLTAARPDGASYSYGTKDMYTDTSGMLYLYLPADTETTAAVPLGEPYAGSITTTIAGTAAGTLTKTATINAAAVNSTYGGSSHAGYLLTSVTNASGATIDPSLYTLTATYYSGTDTTGTKLGGAPTVAGEYTVGLSLSGSSYVATPLTLNFTIAQFSPTITLSGSNAPAAGGVEVTLTATLSKASNGDYPSGNVLFKANGNQIGKGSLTDGQAQYIWTTASTGAYELTAEYRDEENANYAAATGTITSYNISKYNQASLTIGGVPDSITYGDPSVTLIASGGSGSGAVNWSSTDTSVVGVDSATGKVTINGAGSCNITAAKVADQIYNIQSAVTVFTVQKAVPTISTLPTASSISSGSALSASTLTGGTAVGVKGETVSGTFAWTDGTIKVSAAGTYSVTFTPSSANYSAASDNVAVFFKSSGGSGTGSSGGSTITYKYTTTTVSGLTTTATSVTSVLGSDGTAAASLPGKQLAGAIDEAEAAAAGNNAPSGIEINVSKPDSAIGVSLTIPQTALDTLADSSVASFKITTSLGAVTFDSTAIDTINSKASGDITISIKEGDTNSLSDGDKALIGHRPVCDFTVTSRGTTISDFGGGTGTISIPYTLVDGENPNNIVIYYISDNGELVIVPNCVYDSATGTVTFKIKHFSTYAMGYNDVSFTDVASGAWYERYIDFLAARGIISGTGNGSFSPDANITRAQFVMILANLSGDELSGSSSSAFSDVSLNDWYFEAVQWAHEKGVVSGSDGKFEPNASIMRQDIAVMIACYAERVVGYTLPKTTDTVTFTDASDIAAYASDAVAAMQQAGIISGNKGNFSPTKNATRAQAAKMIALLGGIS